jgi:3-phenylpropionate/cinnamic acid dioxygenase small subunit
MSARDEITDLIYTYANRIDAGDFDRVGQLLDNATITFEGYETSVAGAAAITALYAGTTRRFGDGTPRTKHIMTNVMVVVAVDGQSATSSSYYTVLHAVPGEFSLQPVIAGRYRDTFAFVNGSWQFKSMHVIVDLMGDLSSHLAMDL